MAEQSLAVQCEHHAAARAVEQRLVEHTFEPLNLDANRRLSAANPVCRAAKGVVLRDGDKGSK